MTHNKKIIILYPRTTYRNLFLSYILDDKSKSVLYYRIDGENITLSDFIANLITEFSETVAGFGSQTAKLLGKGSPSELAKTLVADINAATANQNCVLYLDEFDAIEIGSAMREFAESLMVNLGDNCQLVVNARVLTLNPWAAAIEKGIATVVGTAYHKNDLIYTIDEKHRPQVEIYAFGRGHAIVNGERIETWDGALPRNMFFYFVDNDLVTRNEIFELFWPKLPVKEATNVFHVTKRKITERMSINIFGGGNYELTNYSGGFYTPSDSIVRHYDVAEFVEAVDAAAMTFDDDEQAVLYERAVNAYRSPFLITINMPWVHERREKLQRMFVEALVGLARIHKAAKRHEEALGYFVRTLKEEPQREDIFREIMMLYSTMGYKDEALRQYKLLETRLRDTLGVPPAEESRAVFDQISGS
ncbi:MAG: bacterial transcriptional activator domain-containing protein [Anaerolineae bacterium]|nr:bacterial transcriptional activator domain-containing protein [Anaerolineae bacterium]MDQ7036359.1 bacterial transcriptional activator domain-containing protein [Anaerolineae bacterium]